MHMSRPSSAASPRADKRPPKITPENWEQFPVQVPDAAGIDIAVTSDLWVAVPPDRGPDTLRRFSPRTKGVAALAVWLREKQIRHVCMEATGIYWIPLYHSLSEAGFIVSVVNARQVRRVRKPKSDLADARWLQYLHSVGMIHHSFIPPTEILALRTIARQRERLIQEAGRQLQYLQQAMDEMNLHLAHVLSDLAGESGQAIIEAILGGERDAARLASLCHHRVKASRETVIEALQGQWREELLFVMAQAHRGRQALLAQIAQCDERLWQLAQGLEKHELPEPVSPPPPPKGRGRPRKEKAAPEAGAKAAEAAAAPAVRRYKPVQGRNAPAGGEAWAPVLHALFGVDLTAVPGVSVSVLLLLLVEIGTEWSKFGSCGSFAAWLGLCPNNETSGRRVLRRKTAPVQSRLKVMLRMAAQSLWQSQSSLGEQYRRYKARLGPAAANTIMAHKLARILHHLVTHQVEYDSTLMAAQDTQRINHQTSNLRRQAKQLGFDLVALPKAA
jgi:transposase